MHVEFTRDAEELEGVIILVGINMKAWLIQQLLPDITTRLSLIPLLNRENRKVTPGQFLTDAEINELKQQYWEAARETKETGEFMNNLPVVVNKYESVTDYEEE